MSEISLLSLLANVVFLIASMQKPSHVEALRMYSVCIQKRRITKAAHGGVHFRLTQIYGIFTVPLCRILFNSHITEVSQELHLRKTCCNVI